MGGGGWQRSIFTSRSVCPAIGKSPRSSVNTVTACSSSQAGRPMYAPGRSQSPVSSARRAAGMSPATAWASCTRRACPIRTRAAGFRWSARRPSGRSLVRQRSASREAAARVRQCSGVDSDGQRAAGVRSSPAATLASGDRRLEITMIIKIHCQRPKRQEHLCPHFITRHTAAPVNDINGGLCRGCG